MTPRQQHYFQECCTWATVLLLAVGLILAGITLSGCASKAPRHQQGGATLQSLGPVPTSEQAFAIPPAYAGSPVQMLQQPENPEGSSVQHITRTTTTTKPDGSVVTIIDRAETTIGGSQDLADIMKEYLGAEYMKRLSIALIMALIAFKIRKDWPIIAGVLSIGALIVAFFGLTYVFAVAGVAGGLFVAYFVVKSQVPLSLP